MIRRSGMRDVKAVRFRHMTAGAIVVLAPHQSIGRGRVQRPLAVTCEATVAVICDFLRGRREMVRIVAGDAAEPTLTGAKAIAFVHLFELADKTLFSPPRRLHKHCPKARKRQSGAIIFIAPADAHRFEHCQPSGIAHRRRRGARASDRAGLTIVMSLPSTMVGPAT